MTIGRGGVFLVKMAAYVMNLLEEPIIIAGSGRGFPSHPRGNNQKATGKPISLFLTETYLAECRKDRLQAQSFWVFKKKWNMCITLA